MMPQDDPRGKPRPSLLRRQTRGLLVSLSALVVILVIGEVAVRLLTDTVRPKLVVDPVLGRRHVRSFDGDVYDPESRREVHWVTNELGFRFPDLPFEKPAGTRRLVLLGDSMIAAWQVEEEKTAARVLEEILNEGNEGDRWEVLNFGVPAAGTGPEYVLYRELARRFEPDVVLCVFFAGNDLGDNSIRLTQRNRIYFDLGEEDALVQLPYPSLGTRFKEMLNEYSRLYVWQKERLKAVKAKPVIAQADATLEARHSWHGDSIRASEWIYFTGEDERTEHAWAVTRAVILALAAEVREDDRALAMVLLPCSQQVHDEEFTCLREVAKDLGDRFDPLHPARQLAEICAEVNVPFFDLIPGFRAAAPSHSELAREEWLFLNGRGHLNEHGNETLGRLLADAVRAVVPE